MHREPPPAATWMLEHMSSGERDEALSGDLLEEFCSGRTDGWYWWQVLAACAVSWQRSLRVRLPLLLFVFVWSMAAPAWDGVCDQIAASPVLAHIWLECGPFWWILALCGWTVLHASFLWAGIAVYVLGQKACGHRFVGHRIRRAVWLAPLILLPAYGCTFVVGNLYWFSWFAHVRLADSLADRIVDVRLLADLLRIPYLTALLGALWGVVPRQRGKFSGRLADDAGVEPAEDTSAVAPALVQEPATIRRYLVLMAGAGLVNAMIPGIALSRLPELHALHPTALLLRAVGLVFAGALAGTAGAWAYWKAPWNPFRERLPLPFGLFALTCASGWVWAPAMTAFAEQASAAASCAAAAGSFFLAYGLRAACFPLFASGEVRAAYAGQGEASLFADVLDQPRMDFYGAGIAVSLYAAGAAVLTGWAYTASLMLVLAVFFFAWKIGSVDEQFTLDRSAYRRAGLRLTVATAVSILLTAWALLDGVAHREAVAHAAVASQHGTAGAGTDRKSQAQHGSNVLAGYESVVLWPMPEKKQIVAPVRAVDSLLVPGSREPLVIHFSGSYRYVQPPNKEPGPLAHVAHGTPLGVDIEVQNTAPLAMDAHQELSGPVRTALCRAIEVEIANADNRPGMVSVALLLSDGRAGHERVLNLGAQPIASTGREHFQVKSVAVHERLRFAVPAGSRLRRFSEMTVLVLPEAEHRSVGPKIAVVGFEIFPR